MNTINPTLKFCKIRHVKSPQRANPTDAGIDVYIPNDLRAEDMTKMDSITGSRTQYSLKPDGTVDTIIVGPAQSVLIPVGIKVKFDDNYALVALNKSGVASKRHLTLGAQVIDSAYMGEVFINLHNIGIESQTLHPGDAITQLVLLPIALPQAEEVSSVDELYNGEVTSRGEGCLGSTDIK